MDDVTVRGRPGETVAIWPRCLGHDDDTPPVWRCDDRAACAVLHVCICVGATDEGGDDE